MEWISVKERFPDLYLPVLAFHKDDGIVYAYRWLDFEADEEDPEKYPAEHAWEYKEGNSIPKKGDMHIWSEHFTAEDKEITHWMPLPFPPKEIK